MQESKYFYKGIPLKEYCDSHPEINYNTIRVYINREKEKNSELSDEELIEQYLDKEHKGIYKYYYFGMPLKQYCDENNLSYKNVIAYMRRYRNADKFKGLSDDEFVEVIMDQYQSFEPKYLYKGLTLSEYCIQNDLSFIMLKYQENYSDEELVNYFNLALDEISQKELEILSLLKNNDDIKVIKKEKIKYK